MTFEFLSTHHESTNVRPRYNMRGYNALINAVNYHHSVISLAQCGKTINYRACKTTLYCQPLCLYHLPPPPLPPPVVHRNIIRRFCSSVPFSEKRDLHLFVRFIHVTLSRASGRFTFIYTNVYGGGIFQPIFRLAPPLFFFFFFFF